MLDFNRYEVFTFDCYGTLINWEEGILRCLRGILSAHGTERSDATLLQLYGEFEARAEEGKYSCYREVLSSVIRRFGDHVGLAVTDQEAAALSESVPKVRARLDRLTT